MLAWKRSHTRTHARTRKAHLFHASVAREVVFQDAEQDSGQEARQQQDRHD